MAGVAVATVRAEEATAVPPETVAVAIASGTIIVRGIVVPVNSWELFIILTRPKQVSTGGSCVATDVQMVIVAFQCNIAVAVLGVAVLTFPVNQVDTCSS